MHTPVYLEEALEALKVEEKGKYIDCTAGEGGHLKKIAEKGAQVLALDYDSSQIENLTKQLAHLKNVKLVTANFKDLESVATENKFTNADGILMDLGLSFRQLMDKGIGLSFNRPQDNLDMSVEGTRVTAAQILNSYTRDELNDMFIRNAEEITSGQIANAIVSQRMERPYKLVQDLLITLRSLGAADQTKARIFQALRMEVNQEKLNLQQAIKGAVEVLKDGGRLVVITFHSLEDRIVKQFGRTEQRLKEVKVKIPRNERAAFERSAQLRVYEKKGI